MSKASSDERTRVLFDDQHMQESPVVEPLTPTTGPTLRVVRWGLQGERACLVRCDNKERNIRSIRKLATLCGTSCTEAKATSRVQPTEDYCQSCLALAGNGVLR